MRKTCQQLSSNSVKGKVVLSVFGVGAGEGLAAVRGHQSGAQGMRVEMPAFSREIEMGEDDYRFPAPPCLVNR